MSDPQTNPSIEDVLSSIRRLVTQGDRAPATGVASEPGGADAHPVAACRDRRRARTRRRPIAELRRTDALDGDWRPARPGGCRGARLAGRSWQRTRRRVRRRRRRSRRRGCRAAGSDRTTARGDDPELEDAVTRQIDDWEPDGSESRAGRRLVRRRYRCRRLLLQPAGAPRRHALDPAQPRKRARTCARAGTEGRRVRARPRRSYAT